MKKILSILSAITISLSSTAAVVACSNPDTSNISKGEEELPIKPAAPGNAISTIKDEYNIEFVQNRYFAFWNIWLDDTTREKDLSLRYMKDLEKMKDSLVALIREDNQLDESQLTSEQITLTPDYGVSSNDITRKLNIFGGKNQLELANEGYKVKIKIILNDEVYESNTTIKFQISDKIEVLENPGAVSPIYSYFWKNFNSLNPKDYSEQVLSKYTRQYFVQRNNYYLNEDFGDLGVVLKEEEIKIEFLNMPDTWDELEQMIVEDEFEPNSIIVDTRVIIENKSFVETDIVVVDNANRYTFKDETPNYNLPVPSPVSAEIKEADLAINSTITNEEFKERQKYFGDKMLEFWKVQEGSFNSQDNAYISTIGKHKEVMESAEITAVNIRISYGEEINITNMNGQEIIEVMKKLLKAAGVTPTPGPIKNKTFKISVTVKTKEIHNVNTGEEKVVNLGEFKNLYYTE